MRKLFYIIILSGFFVNGSYAEIPLLKLKYWGNKKLTLEKVKADIKKYNLTDINKRNKYDKTIIDYACGDSDSIEIVRYLISLGSNIKDCTPLGMTFNRNVEILKLVLENGGGNTEDKNDGGGTLLLSASRYNGNHKIIETLLKYGANTNHLNNDKKNALYYAIISKPININIIRVLIENGINMNQMDKYGNTPLLKAVQDGVPKKIVKLLLENGADPHIKKGKRSDIHDPHPMDGKSAYDYAEMYKGNGYYEIMKPYKKD